MRCGGGESGSIFGRFFVVLQTTLTRWCEGRAGSGTYCWRPNKDSKLLLNVLAHGYWCFWRMYLTIHVDGICLLDASLVTWGKQKRKMWWRKRRKLLILGASEPDLESEHKQHKRTTTSFHDYDE